MACHLQQWPAVFMKWAGLAFDENRHRRRAENKNTLGVAPVDDFDEKRGGLDALARRSKARQCVGCQFPCKGWRKGFDGLADEIVGKRALPPSGYHGRMSGRSFI